LENFLKIYIFNVILIQLLIKSTNKIMSKKFWFFLTIILALTCIVFLEAGCFAKNQKGDNEFIASGHPEWAPIMYQKNDLIVGAGPDITIKVFNDLGIKISSLYKGSWDVVQESAKSGKIDVLVAAYKTTGREEYMDYSIPYTVDPVSLFVKNGKDFVFTKKEDLIGKKGVATIGDSYGQEFDDFLNENLDVKRVATPDEAFTLLIDGEADYFIYALYSGENALIAKKLTDQIVILPNYVSEENFYLTISKKSPLVKYLSQVNSLLEKYKADGTIGQIIEKEKNILLNK
jgi:polar amino acid transport system substrate-binding protein